MSRLSGAAISGSTITLSSPTAPMRGDKLTFDWTTDAPDPKNWIGVYDGDRKPGNGASLVWTYVSGTSGRTTLDTSGLSGGPFTVYLLAKDGYGILAQSTPFTFAGPPTGDSIVLRSPASPYEGDKLTFHWTTDTPHPKNWIGVYDGDRKPGNGGSLVWQYTPAASGDITLDTSGLSGGPYTAYLLAKDGYGILARTTPFSFTVRPVIPRPHAVVDALTTAPQDAGADFSVRLAGLWIRPEGNAAGGPAFTRVSGDPWLSVSANGTVSGTAPASRPKTPGRLVVSVQDSAVGADTVTVQVPVRTAKDKIQIKIATLNLWDAGAHVGGSLEKQLRLVLTQGLDVVALQETGDAAATALGEALGWQTHQTGSGLGIVSRYPLSDLLAPTADLPAAAATVQLPGRRTVRLWTARLDEADYGPYALAAGQTAAQVEAAEKLTLRYSQVQALVAAMRSDLASDVPVILAAGLASPSHLDWTNRTASAHAGVGKLRWPVTDALQRAGLTDAFREANSNPVKDPGVTWSPVRPEHDGGGAEPQDRIDQVQYAGPLKVVEAHSLYTGWPRPVPDTAANGWPSDHAAAVVTFSLSARG
ncbi:endonuclease/exonuclease/phosphatase family protein [Sphaerisporangium sp. NPDC051017]|uniref:endonuclease/exonuclease/phosphatase family protein n=1 Tax=Sphaerisporangium sp. NPDC051017 TaxID=3154636 RepID=UPI003433A6FA